ncbi:hypothetical protein ACFWUZ_18170 [Streptomyces sp. NPDC058646]|uniref:hypothetical protein n=1 Tax=Streptomyces sp. NPDC058646 TaxID=3346574 RepID=UPI00365EF78D
MLKWTLRATAVLAIAAALATPVAVTPPEAVVATPAVAVSVATPGPGVLGVELTSGLREQARTDRPVAF